MAKIQRVKAKKSPSLAHESKANELIDNINGLIQATFSPTGFATIKSAKDGKVTYTLQVLKTIPLIVDGTPGFYDIIAKPAEAGGTQDEAKQKLIAALGFESKTVRVIEVSGDPEAMTATTTTILRQVETPP